MNITGKFLLAFLCISIASYGLSGSVYASSHNLLPLSVATNSDSYAAGDTILIFGSIRDYDGKYPDVTIQIFGPLGGLKMIKQLAVESDGSFSFTAIAAGTINLTGEYIVKAMWNKQPAEAMFEFVGGAAPEPVNDAAAEAAAAEAAAAEAAAAEAAAAAAEAAAAEAAAADAAAAAKAEYKANNPPIDFTDTLIYSVSSGSVSSITSNSDDATLVVAIDTSDDGELSINLDNDNITAFDDGSYFVLVNNEEVEFSQDGNDLTIPYEAGTEKIEIVASAVVPEFGTIAMIVLAVAIVSIIVLTTKTRTTLIPKL